MDKDVWTWAFRFFQGYSARLSVAHSPDEQARIFAEALPSVKAVADLGDVEQILALAVWEMVSVTAKKALRL